MKLAKRKTTAYQYSQLLKACNIWVELVTVGAVPLIPPPIPAGCTQIGRFVVESIL
jgi:hypothetical protein